MRFGPMSGLTLQTILNCIFRTPPSQIGEHLAIWRIYYGFFCARIVLSNDELSNIIWTEFKAYIFISYVIKHIRSDVICAVFWVCVSVSVCLPAPQNQQRPAVFLLFLCFSRNFCVRHINVWVELILNSNSWAMMIYGVRFWFDPLVFSGAFGWWPMPKPKPWRFIFL